MATRRATRRKRVQRATPFPSSSAGTAMAGPCTRRFESHPTKPPARSGSSSDSKTRLRQDRGWQALCMAGRRDPAAGQSPVLLCVVQSIVQLHSTDGLVCVLPSRGLCPHYGRASPRREGANGHGYDMRKHARASLSAVRRERGRRFRPPGDGASESNREAAESHRLGGPTPERSAPLARNRQPIRVTSHNPAGTQSRLSTTSTSGSRPARRRPGDRPNIQVRHLETLENLGMAYTWYTLGIYFQPS